MHSHAGGPFCAPCSASPRARTSPGAPPWFSAVWSAMRRPSWNPAAEGARPRNAVRPKARRTRPQCEPPTLQRDCERLAALHLRRDNRSHSRERQSRINRRDSPLAAAAVDWADQRPPQQAGGSARAAKQSTPRWRAVGSDRSSSPAPGARGRSRLATPTPSTPRSRQGQGSTGGTPLPQQSAAGHCRQVEVASNSTMAPLEGEASRACRA